VRKLSTRQLPEHETAFAMTIHKSQGSEFKRLLLILPDEMSQVLSKELIYTGITRAKQRLMLAGNQQTFIQACRKSVQRQSGLAEKLGW
jgi:exodeoxyribonuclease V alpha subunit